MLERGFGLGLYFVKNSLGRGRFTISWTSVVLTVLLVGELVADLA